MEFYIKFYIKWSWSESGRRWILNVEHDSAWPNQPTDWSTFDWPRLESPSQSHCHRHNQDPFKADSLPRTGTNAQGLLGCSYPPFYCFENEIMCKWKFSNFRVLLVFSMLENSLMWKVFPTRWFHFLSRTIYKGCCLLATSVAFCKTEQHHQDRLQQVSFLWIFQLRGQGAGSTRACAEP